LGLGDHRVGISDRCHLWPATLSAHDVTASLGHSPRRFRRRRGQGWDPYLPTTTTLEEDLDQLADPAAVAFGGIRLRW